MPITTTEQEIQSWLRLSLEPGVGAVTAKQLLSAFGLPEQIFKTKFSQLQAVVGAKLALQLSHECTPEIQQYIDKTLEWLVLPEHYILTLADQDYPASLLDSFDPPVLLYADGQLETLQKNRLAMVGARNATLGGQANARSFAKYLAEQGWCIVSGLAHGIDAASHQGALQSGRPHSTIAVIGTGINRVYPAKNKDLALLIKNNGLIIGEQPLDTSALAQHFPMRNRIVAGLSRGVLVVEAAKQSGSLITARLATEASKEVFAIPGSIHSTLSRGCHDLIRQGAKLVETGQDVLEELGYAAPSSKPKLSPAVTPEQSRLLDTMGYDPVRLEDLAESLSMDFKLLAPILLSMELRGLLLRLADGRYQQVTEA